MFSFRPLLRSLVGSGLLFGLLPSFFAVFLAVTCSKSVEGFSAETNERLQEFFERHRHTQSRKVAVFDGDGTVFGQVPHYLADECLFQYAKKHPAHRPEIIERMKGLSNVSIPYVQMRVHYFAGQTPEFLRELGQECYERDYRGREYPQMKRLISLLQDEGFEVWIVTASPEVLYQGFLSETLGIPLTNVVGVKSIVREGRMSEEIVQPVPQDEGKLEAIATFVQARPLLVGGNSRGDREMIGFASDLHLIINPDEHVEAGETESVASVARQSGWLVERIEDRSAAGFPAVSREYGIRQNKEH